MAKIIFKYGEMNSGKTMDLLTNEYVLSSKQMKVSLIKPELDTRENNIKSRVGLQKKVDYVIPKDIELSDIDELKDIISSSDVVLVDESQFINYSLLKVIGKWVHCMDSNVTIIFYGLLKDFNNNIFDGSKALLEIADTIIPIHKMCEYPSCKHKATCNYLKNKPTYGNVSMGDSEYVSLCQEHYYKKQMEEE